jgi:hypothetical protein
VFSIPLPSAALAGAWAGLLLDIDLPDVRLAIRTANGVTSKTGRFDSAMPAPTEVLAVGAVDTFASTDGSHVRVDNVALYLP